MTDVRALILSWEYPPLIEGGLARHVRKLAENLADQGTDVHVLARGREEDPQEAEMGGVLVHRVREPERPRDLGEFVAWIEHMNSDMLAAGVEAGDRWDFDVVHGHDWLVASAGDHLAKRFRAPLVTTIHATESGVIRAGWSSHPQSYIHGVERWMANRAERVITCSAYMREHVADIYGLGGAPDQRDPQRDRPLRACAGGRPRLAAGPFRRSGRATGAAGRAGSSTRRAFSWHWRRFRASSSGSGTSASWSPDRARRSMSCVSRPAGWAWTPTGPSWAGSATTSSTRSTASPT